MGSAAGAAAAEAAGGRRRLTELAQLRLQVRGLIDRVTALEANPARARRAPRSRQAKPHYVDISPEEHLARVNLWSHWQLLRRAEAGKTFNRRRGECEPWSVDAFCMRVVDAEGRRFNAREVWRWLSDTRTHAAGGRQDLRIAAAIKAAIAGMIASGVRLSPGM
jgi:hypothetical protein